MKIDRIAMTGADDTLTAAELIPLSQKYPHLEWAILLSVDSAGRSRFPSYHWMRELKAVAKDHNLVLAGHLCGKWVRNLVNKGEFAFRDDYPWLYEMFPRIQLNFHAEDLKVVPEFYDRLRESSDKQFIFQMDGVNNGLAHQGNVSGIDIVPLFDTSGGAGIVPESWDFGNRDWCADRYQGYAGGLGPHNLAIQLDDMASAVGDRIIWIDMETWIRTGPNFDLEKVERCLEIGTNWRESCPTQPQP